MSRKDVDPREVYARLARNPLMGAALQLYNELKGPENGIAAPISYDLPPGIRLNDGTEYSISKLQRPYKYALWAMANLPLQYPYAIGLSAVEGVLPRATLMIRRIPESNPDQPLLPGFETANLRQEEFIVVASWDAGLKDLVFEPAKKGQNTTNPVALRLDPDMHISNLTTYSDEQNWIIDHFYPLVGEINYHNRTHPTLTPRVPIKVVHRRGNKRGILLPV